MAQAAPSPVPAARARFTPREVQVCLYRARHLPANVDEATVRTLYDQAERAMSAGFMEPAREIVSLLLKTRYRTCEMYCFLGESYFEDYDMKSSDSTLAREYFAKALRYYPDCSLACVDMAYYELSQDNLEEALKFANRALSCTHVYERSYLVRSKVLSALKRYPEALVDIQRAEQFGPKRVEIYRVKGSLLEKLERYDEAIKAFDQAYALLKQDWIVYQIVHCLDKLGRYKEAINRIGLALALNPDDGEAYRERAELKVKAKDLPGAVKDLTRAIELEPTAKTYRQRAHVYSLMGDKKSAGRDLAEADNIISKKEPF